MLHFTANMTASFTFLQQTWREEVSEYTERVKGEDSSLPLIDHDILVRFCLLLLQAFGFVVEVTHR